MANRIAVQHHVNPTGEPTERPGSTMHRVALAGANDITLGWVERRTLPGVIVWLARGPRQVRVSGQTHTRRRDAAWEVAATELAATLSREATTL